MADATPLVLAQHTHRPAPDGTRRLTFRSTVSLRLGQSKEPRGCYVAQVHASNNSEPPTSCQREIRPGLFFLIYRPVQPSTEQLGSRNYYYCAPCAVREWVAFGCREVDE